MSDYIVVNKNNRDMIENLETDYAYQRKVFKKKYSSISIKGSGGNGMNFEFYDRVDSVELNNSNPGVYILYTVYKDFLLFYVGKSRDPKQRQKQHSKSSEKDIFEHAIVITMANNGFDESDISNLENALYLDFKRRDGILLLNDNIPSKDKNYNVDEIYVLEWTKCISTIVLNHIVGKKIKEYAFEPIEPFNYSFNLIQNGLSNIKITKNPKHKNVFIIKNSILSVSSKLDSDKKLFIQNFLLENKQIIKEVDLIINDYRLYIFLETKKIANADFLKIFSRESIKLFMDYNGNVSTLRI
jgi:hypothetical protein